MKKVLTLSAVLICLILCSFAYAGEKEDKEVAYEQLYIQNLQLRANSAQRDLSDAQREWPVAQERLKKALDAQKVANDKEAKKK